MTSSMTPNGEQRESGASLKGGAPKTYVSLEHLLHLIESDELYDILPGNGQDDFILEWLRTRISEMPRIVR